MAATYRPVSKNDIGIAVSMMQEFYAIDDYPIDIEQSKKLFERFIADEKLGKAWLIWDENEIVGYIILTFVFSFEYGGLIAFVDELYISERARGKGLGKSSIEFMKAEAQKLELKLLYLEVEHHNSNAQKLYLSAGFSEHKRKLMYYKTPN
ncbi:GNAT family N-acetyltransferase [Flavobacterium sp.]|uniref:GNAT family N-acetyltransferase n=1 Tax=Flavobacterium sp. TaxID=239 RepID=UPI0039E2819C